MFKSKKLIATLMIVAMLLTLIPMAAFAAAIPATAGTISPSISAVGETATYTVSLTIGATANTDTVTAIVTDSATPNAPVDISGAAVITAVVDSTGAAANFAFPVCNADGTIVLTANGANTAGTYTFTFDLANPVAGTYKLKPGNDATVATTFATFTTRAANRFASIVTYDKTSVKSSGEDFIKITAYVRDANNNPVSGVPVYFASSRGDVDQFSSAKSKTSPLSLLAGGDPVYSADTNVNGQVVVYVRSQVAGAPKIGVGLEAGTPGAKTLYQYLIGNTGTAGATQETCGLVKVQDITFTAASATGVTVSGVTVNGDTVPAGTGAAVTAPKQGTYTGAKGNGIDYYEISFKVTAAGNAPVSGQEVTFSVNKSGATLNKTAATTNAIGVAKVRVAATKPGQYEVKAVAGDEDRIAVVDFSAAGLFKVSKISGGNETVAKKEDYSLEFKFEDNNGNQIDFSGIGTTANITGNTLVTGYGSAYSSIKFELTTKPTDSDAVTDITNSNSTTEYKFNSTSTKDLKLTIGKDMLDTEGEYVLRASLSNGAYVDVPFTVKKQGSITKVTISYKQPAIPLKGQTGNPTIKYYDAEGVAVTKTYATADHSISVSNGSIAYVGSSGEIISQGDKDNTGKVVVTLVAKDKNLAATTEVSVVKDPNRIEAVATKTAGEVGKDLTVDVALYDASNNIVAVGSAVPYTLPATPGSGYTVKSKDVYVVGKPAGAIVSADFASDFNKKFTETGKGSFTVSSNVEGKIDLQVVVELNNEATNVAQTYTSPVSVNFGPEIGSVDKGATSLVLQIGSKIGFQDGAAIDTADFAPFIKNDTTFVPVRVLANAFNAEAAWDGATNTATLTRADIKITLVAGDKNVKVEKDGVETTIEANEALFINENNRLCAPMRAIAEAFGADLDYGPKDGAVEWVSFTQAK